MNGMISKAIIELVINQTIAIRFASFGAPIDVIKAVNVVPMLAPITIAIAEASVIEESPTSLNE